MLKLISYGSSSKGNCHILYNGKSALMLDCGVNMKDYNYELEKYNIQGILITHEHQDHCKGLKDKTYRGNQNVYSSNETLNFIGDSILDYRKCALKPLKPIEIGEDWTIVAIDVLHDVKNYGYIIKDNVTNTKIAYLTDLGYSDSLLIKGINTFIIEANHIRTEIEEKYDKAYENGESDVAYYNRLLSDKGHLSLEDSCKFIRNNIGYGLKHVILCHISHSERNYKRFEDLYLNELKRIEMPINGFKIHAINNHIKKCEEYAIIDKNKWENIEL